VASALALRGLCGKGKSALSLAQLPLAREQLVLLLLHLDTHEPGWVHP
jgi:hypothetical protein